MFAKLLRLSGRLPLPSLSQGVKDRQNAIERVRLDSLKGTGGLVDLVEMKGTHDLSSVIHSKKLHQLVQRTLYLGRMRSKLTQEPTDTQQTLDVPKTQSNCNSAASSVIGEDLIEDQWWEDVSRSMTTLKTVDSQPERDELSMDAVTTLDDANGKRRRSDAHDDGMDLDSSMSSSETYSSGTSTDVRGDETESTSSSASPPPPNSDVLARLHHNVPKRYPFKSDNGDGNGSERAPLSFRSTGNSSTAEAGAFSLAGGDAEIGSLSEG